MPDFLSHPDFYVPFLIFAGVYLALWAIKNIGIVKLRKISAHTDNYLDDIVLNVLSVTKSFFIFSVSFFVAFQASHFDKKYGKYADNIFIILVAIQAVIWGMEAISSWVNITIQRKQNDPSIATTLGFVKIVLKFVVMAIVFLFALNNLGVNISTFIAGLGVGGIAIALATQNILGDLFSSLSIVLDKPFIVGDYISLGEWQGTIEHVGLKNTRIRSLTGEQIIVSNSDLLSSKIRNFKRMETRRVAFTLNLKYSTKRDDLKRVPQIVETIIRTYPETNFDRAHFLNFGASSLDVEVVYIFNSSDFKAHANTLQAILLDIHEALETNKVELAYPTQSIILENTALNQQ